MWTKCFGRALFSGFFQTAATLPKSHILTGSTKFLLCLGEQPGKDLVNAKGESYPVGLVYGDWASAQVLAEIAHIAIEEILGYNTLLAGVLTGSLMSWSMY